MPLPSKVSDNLIFVFSEHAIKQIIKGVIKKYFFLIDMFFEPDVYLIILIICA